MVNYYSEKSTLTINELIETEKPSILIPFPYSKNNHQEKNAMILAESGGSVLMNQSKISKEVFEETIERIFKRKSKNGKYYYEILDIMKKNMENNNKIKSKIELSLTFSKFYIKKNFYPRFPIDLSIWLAFLIHSFKRVNVVSVLVFTLRILSNLPILRSNS